VIVLGTTALVSSIALFSLVTLQIQSQSKDLTRDRRQAELIARGMVDQARWFIESDTAWRTNQSVGIWTTLSNSINTGQVEVLDPDGNLNDDPMDSITIVGTGIVGNARQKVSVTMYAVAEPIPAITTPVFAANAYTVATGQRATVMGGPVFSSTSITNLGTLVGDAASPTFIGVPPTGTRTTGVEPRPAPDASVFNYYFNLGQAIPNTTQIEDQLLTPNVNTMGPTQANGLYSIDTGGQDIQIRDTRVVGTLVIKCGVGRYVKLKDRVLMQPARPDYPVLITDGNIEFDLASGSQNLREADAGRNFNPTGAPFEGITNSDMVDVYPNEVRGLVHARNSVNMKNESRLIGSVVTDGFIFALDRSNIYYDANLTTNPPVRYSTVKMKIQPLSWRRIVD
jgi:hypothetical protein